MGNARAVQNCKSIHCDLISQFTTSVSKLILKMGVGVGDRGHHPRKLEKCVTASAVVY